MKKSVLLVAGFVFGLLVLAMMFGDQPTPTVWHSANGLVTLNIDTLMATAQVFSVNAPGAVTTYCVELPLDQDGDGNLGIDEIAEIHWVVEGWNKRVGSPPVTWRPWHDETGSWRGIIIHSNK